MLQRERLIFGAVVAKVTKGVNKYVSISNRPIAVTKACKRHRCFNAVAQLLQKKI
jgi:hypothetical protein